MIQIAARSQLTLALASECMGIPVCRRRATVRVTCGDYVGLFCIEHMPTLRQIDELAALDGVDVHTEPIA